MTIGALAGLAGPAMGLVGEALKMGTELLKMAQSQSGNKDGGDDKDKIAQQEMHNHKRVEFGGEGGSSTNHINIETNVIS